jgi:ABC-type polysaccharide/polyol phosphate export permease
MAGLIEGYRQVILRGHPPHLGYLGLVASVAVVVFFFSYWYFKREEMNFADVI